MANAKTSLTRRTLHYYWKVTRRHKALFAALMVSTFAFVALLSYGNPYVMSLIVDQVSAQPVEADQVFTVFGPYIVALILINVFGQAASKLQDYTMYKLEIAASYDLATMSFDALCNQSMSFHSNRFGGTLVSQTTKFMSAYQQLIETIMFPFLPVICSVIFTCGILLPRVLLYVAILMVLLAVYASISYYLYKRILSLNEKAASAQNQLSGELSDSVANILAVKTYGREDYERGLFDNANREVVARDSKRMWASLTRGIITACITVVIMSVVTVFIAGGNAWYGITPGTLVVMFTYTYTVTNQFNFINNGLQRFNRAFGDASGMTAILDEPRLVADKPGAPDLKVSRGAIDFQGIDFFYTDGNVKTQVFDKFELHISAGQRVGLVGMSGAGKTTLTKLLLRLSDIQEGQILIDGQNIADTTQQSLRRQIAYVPQEALLFHRSIAENISYGKPDASMEQIRRAAKQANALEFIESFRRDLTPSRENAASSFLAASVSVLPLRVRSWPTAQCWCLMKQQVRSILKVKSWFKMPWLPSWKVVRASWLRIVCPRWPVWTGSWCLMAAESSKMAPMMNWFPGVGNTPICGTVKREPIWNNASMVTRWRLSRSKVIDDILVEFYCVQSGKNNLIWISQSKHRLSATSMTRLASM